MVFAVVIAATGASEPEWYQHVVGVLGIPGAIIAGTYSWLLIKKTRLESRKTELEIREKEIALAGSSPEVRAAVREVLQPLAESRRLEGILLRFIFVYLAFVTWSAITSVLNFLVDVVPRLASSSDIYLPYLYADLLDLAIDWIPALGYVLIVLFLGLPLLREVNRTLGVTLKVERSDFRRTPRAHEPG